MAFLDIVGRKDNDCFHLNRIISKSNKTKDACSIADCILCETSGQIVLLSEHAVAMPQFHSGTVCPLFSTIVLYHLLILR